MKKNTILYILLIFLIVVNGFFLFNYMGKNSRMGEKGPQRDKDFIVKELGFNATQLAQFKENSEGHHETIMHFSDDIKILKDKLFSKLSENRVNALVVDSITTLIGEKEKQKQNEIFSHFAMIQKLCDEKQKKKFKTILLDALRRSDRGNRPPPRKGKGHRPPPRDK
jgi:hypothetical protein